MKSDKMDPNGARLNSRVNPDKTISLYRPDGAVMASFIPEDLTKYLN